MLGAIAGYMNGRASVMIDGKSINWRDNSSRPVSMAVRSDDEWDADPLDDFYAHHRGTSTDQLTTPDSAPPTNNKVQPPPTKGVNFNTPNEPKSEARTARNQTVYSSMALPKDGKDPGALSRPSTGYMGAPPPPPSEQNNLSRPSTSYMGAPPLPPEQNDLSRPTTAYMGAPPLPPEETSVSVGWQTASTPRSGSGAPRSQIGKQSPAQSSLSSSNSKVIPRAMTQYMGLPPPLPASHNDEDLSNDLLDEIDSLPTHDASYGSRPSSVYSEIDSFNFSRPVSSYGGPSAYDDDDERYSDVDSNAYLAPPSRKTTEYSPEALPVIKKPEPISHDPSPRKSTYQAPVTQSAPAVKKPNQPPQPNNNTSAASPSVPTQTQPAPKINNNPAPAPKPYDHSPNTNPSPQAPRSTTMASHPTNSSSSNPSSHPPRSATQTQPAPKISNNNSAPAPKPYDHSPNTTLSPQAPRSTTMASHPTNSPSSNNVASRPANNQNAYKNNPNNNHNYSSHVDHNRPQQAIRYYGDCFRCKGSIISGVPYLQAEGVCYHVGCFSCTLCGQDLSFGGHYFKDPRDNRKLLCLNCHHNIPGARCGGCSSLISEGEFIKALDQNFHKQCFRCIGCSRPINYETKFWVKDVGGRKAPCCGECQMRDSTKCATCGRAILEGQITKALGKTFHSVCFCCSRCSSILSGEFYQKGGSLVCSRCV
eukprot:TRINITY_DN1440_c0_g1_i1.p1 TRINITY_DN1440_c0_g1~~TRINITY_DN1440_c0_g1_i1.p1  ORF type:complete len:703 (-),score=100.35 TRINITY_DN1440_c0_g1_i1:38-2146(-)